VGQAKINPSPLVELPDSESPRGKPRGFRGKALQFYFASLSPDPSRGDSKEKANRGLTQPYAGLAGPFPPTASSGVPGLFPMELNE